MTLIDIPHRASDRHQRHVRIDDLHRRPLPFPSLQVRRPYEITLKLQGCRDATRADVDSRLGRPIVDGQFIPWNSGTGARFLGVGLLGGVGLLAGHAGHSSQPERLRFQRGGVDEACRLVPAQGPVWKRIAAPMAGGIFTSFASRLVVYPAIYEIRKWHF